MLHYFWDRVPSCSYNPTLDPVLLLGNWCQLISRHCHVFVAFQFKKKGQTVLCYHKINALALAQTWTQASQCDGRQTTFQPQHAHADLKALLTFLTFLIRDSLQLPVQNQTTSIWLAVFLCLTKSPFHLQLPKFYHWNPSPMLSGVSLSCKKLQAHSQLLYYTPISQLTIAILNISNISIDISANSSKV